jgi:nitrogen fixation NifU-like protein
MTTLLKGKTTEEARSMFVTFHDLVTGTLKDISFEHLGKLAAFAGVSEFPARVKCASLAWHTMRNALEAETGTVSTE